MSGFRGLRGIVGLSAWLLAGAARADAILDAELAGRALGAYPHVEFIQNFGPLEPVLVAVDPLRHPMLAGATCDIHVVADKSAAAWAMEPTLTDMTDGGFLPHAFSMSGVAANRVVVAAGGELSSDAGAGLGVPYDVVLDCNRNGLLDGGDVIDGHGDEAGLYAVADTAVPGPLAHTSLTYTAGPYTQVAYYPVDVASMGLLPLVVVSHGWTHEPLWYDHIGRHLASYGYVVMSHANDVGDGGPLATWTASTATLDNIDVLLGHPPEAAAFAEHVDPHRIVLIGHSTGGEGVVRAYTRLRDGDYVPRFFGAQDVVLVTPLAPVAWLNAQLVNPFDVPFHIFGGAADTDVSNAPLNTYVLLFLIYERATGDKSVTYLHGAGHADFHNGSQPTEDWAFGPELLGRSGTHPVLLSYLLPLVELYAKGNPAGREYLTRPDDTFPPPGVAPDVVLAQEHRQARARGSFVLDDYQFRLELNVASSGGAVSWSVGHLAEVLMRDVDGSFAWSETQPGNGLTRARSGDDNQRGAVFDWSPGSPAFYQIGIVPAQRDLTDDGFLSFRAAQGTRHPETVALDGPLSFTVTLLDGQGGSSSIATSSYGAITRPYQRTGAGAGVGWASEFNTVRLRLTDFLADGATLDLHDVAAVRFEFGANYGSPRGRLALDDVELTDPVPPRPFVLAAERAAGTLTLRWPPQPQALAFRTYRGTIPLEGLAGRGAGYAAYDHACFEAADAFGDGALVTTDPAPIPLNRAGFYYVVSAVTAAGEGSLGDASIDLDPVAPASQTARPVGAPCP